MEITGVHIPADMEKPIERVTFEVGDISTMQRYVGGNFEGQNIDRPSARLWFNAEGKFADAWEINRRATWLLWIHKSEFCRMDVIAGDALLTGPADSTGRTMSVPDELIKLLFETSRFTVEAQTRKDGPWHGSGFEFASWEQAYQAGIALTARQTHVRHVRIVPA